MKNIDNPQAAADNVSNSGVIAESIESVADNICEGFSAASLQNPFAASSLDTRTGSPISAIANEAK